MSFDAWLTLIVIVVTVVLLVLERVPPLVTILGAVILLFVTGVIDDEQAFAGFSNPAPITIVALYVLAGAAEVTGALEPLTNRVLGQRPTDGTVRSERRDLTRIVVPTTAASAFIANTPLVGMLAPRVAGWARRSKRVSSRYLMPLSYAAVFGGCITVLGTSTNLTVSGLLDEVDQRPFDLFEITPVGLPIAIGGAVLLVLLTPRLLPRRESLEQRSGGAREFTVEMEVRPGSSMAGKSIADAGLRNLDGVFLVAIERGGHVVAPVRPEEELKPSDRLTFAGNVERILDLQRLEGLVSAAQPHFPTVGPGTEAATFEVVVAEGSPLVGSTLKDVGFRGRYGGAVYAIHRAGTRIPGKLGEARLRAGDLLLVLADLGFRERWHDQHDFLVVSPLETGGPVRPGRARVVELAMLALIVVAGTGLLDLLQASLLIAGALVVFGVITPTEARRSVDLEIVLLIAASFGLGEAMAASGLAEEIGQLLVSGFEHFGDVGILAGVLIATMLLTELLSNNAAAVLMFPIALASASEAGLQSRPFALAILIGASLSFLTPIGYQTNLMVLGMGGYRFRDFTRVGAPLTLLVIVSSLVLIPVFFPLR
ncbi:MAG: SLC13 family permease [Acidimicrobiia bacterium]